MGVLLGIAGLAIVWPLVVLFLVIAVPAFLYALLRNGGEGLRWLLTGK